MPESKVIKFEPVSVGDGYRFDPNQILDGAKEAELISVVILGEMPDGSVWVSANANAGETMVLMERAKRLLVFGEDT